MSDRQRSRLARTLLIAAMMAGALAGGLALAALLLDVAARLLVAG